METCVCLFCQINAKMQSELVRSIYMSIVQVSLCWKGRTAKPTLNGARVHFQCLKWTMLCGRNKPSVAGLLFAY